MYSDLVALATLIFAAMAGLGSLVRVVQNERLWRRVYRPRHSRPRLRSDFLSSDLAEIPEPDEGGCLHPSVLAWAGRCMGCRRSKLPPVRSDQRKGFSQDAA